MAHETPQEQNVRLKLENEALRKENESIKKEAALLLDWLEKFGAAGGTKADLDKFLVDLDARKKAVEERNKELLGPAKKDEKKEEEKKEEKKGEKPGLLGQIFGDFKRLLS